MHFQFSFIVLLASFMIDLPFMPVQVQAAPAKRNAGMVTLPLKRLHQARDDIHPHVVSIDYSCNVDSLSLKMAFSSTSCISTVGISGSRA